MIWKKILWINIIVHLLAHYTTIPFASFALWPNSEFERPYQYITHMFLHTDLLHILFNMLIFASFAPIVEKKYGQGKFLLLYLLSGIGAAFLHIYITGDQIPMVGASGAIFGVVILATLIDPKMKVFLFGLLPISIMYITSILLILELYQGIINPNDGVAHFAHIGGALTAFILFLFNKYYYEKR